MSSLKKNKIRHALTKKNKQKKSKFYEISPTNFGWKFGYGFFSNYRICLEQLIVHFQTKSKTIPYINWAKTTWVEGFNPFESTVCKSNENPFDWWFEQTIPTNNDTIIKCTNGPRPDLIDHAQHYFNNKVSLDLQQKVDKLYIKPKKYIMDQIEDIYNKEFKNEVVLGIMARGSEYNTHHPMYGVFGIEQYILEIKNVLETHKNITKLFIVSEETEYVNKIHEAFPNSYFVPNVFRRTDETDEYINHVHCWINVSKKRDLHTKKLGEECIIQTKLLGKCDYLFGRHCGLIAGAVLWNDNIKDVIIIK